MRAFDEAIKTLHALNEETVLAGFPAGDRVQTLANVRKMAELLRDAETALSLALSVVSDKAAGGRMITTSTEASTIYSKGQDVLARIRAAKGNK